LGEENEDLIPHHQLAWERLIIACEPQQSIETLFEETWKYSRERKVSV